MKSEVKTQTRNKASKRKLHDKLSYPFFFTDKITSDALQCFLVDTPFEETPPRCNDDLDRQNAKNMLFFPQGYTMTWERKQPIEDIHGYPLPDSLRYTLEVVHASLCYSASSDTIRGSPKPLVPFDPSMALLALCCTDDHSRAITMAPTMDVNTALHGRATTKKEKHQSSYLEINPKHVSAPVRLWITFGNRTGSKFGEKSSPQVQARTSDRFRGVLRHG